MSAPRPELRALADRLGILPSYRDTSGDERETSDATRERLVRAFGYEAGDETSARRARETLESAAAERLLEPVLVWREWEHGQPMLAVNPRALRGAREYALELRCEDGAAARGEGRIAVDAETRAGDPLTLPLPARIAPGYHEVVLELHAPAGTRRATQHLIMAPRTVLQPEEVLGDERVFGILANLYTLRGRGGFGHGHFGDLAALARFAGAQGADFVGVNPLHALQDQRLTGSPYSPISRLYRNPLYLDPEQVPELAGCEEARRLLDESSLRRRREALQRADELDHDAIARALMPVLRALHACFARAQDSARARAYAEYRRKEGQALDDFASWEVLCRELAPAGAPPALVWWEWPPPFRDPRSSAVASLRQQRADEMDFRRWLQFELERQLGEAASAARAAGCRIGLYPDLALGAARASADTWMEQEAFALGASIGAPPDAYAIEGQNWGLPPLRPDALRRDGYRFFARILRANLAHAGALRLDHAMGLVRLFWIPEGRPGSEGAYVAYRADELLGVLALESRRQHALVIAEDLGTLPPELPGLLAEWGLLRSAVMRFERDAQGRFRESREYPRRALATLGTHDLPPFEGFLAGADLELRAGIGALAPGTELAAARVERESEIAALRARLGAEGLLDDAEHASPAALARAADAFLAGTPSLLVGASLDDLAGEQQPVNLPGIAMERHRSWSRRMAAPLEDVLASRGLARRIEPFRARSRRPRSRD